MKLKIILGAMTLVYVTILYLLLYSNVEIALKKTIETSTELDKRVKRLEESAPDTKNQWTLIPYSEYSKSVKSKSSTATEIGVPYSHSKYSTAENRLDFTESPEHLYEMFRNKLCSLVAWNPITIIHGCPFPLEAPIKTIFINETMTPNCLTHVMCLQFLEKLPVYSTDDLWFNFMLGGNGIIYEGRGTACPIGRLGSKSIVVTVVGDSTEETNMINERQYEALQLLIAANIFIGEIDVDYQLAPTCCIVPGSNPGLDFYLKLSKKFGHFYSQCNKMDKCKYNYT